MDANDAIIKISGRNKEALVGKTIFSLSDLFTPESFALIQANFKKRMSGEPVPPYEINVIDTEGRKYCFELHGIRLKDACFKDGGSLIIMHDVTERDRLAKTKDAFVGTVSHELRTPLAIIRENISQVLDGLAGA